jgi:hypothetical protein
MPALSLVPAFDDTVYLVLNDYGKLGHAFVETPEDQADLGTVIEQILGGEYGNPLRVIAFNAAEGWAHDVSEEIARELTARAAARDRELSEGAQRFVRRHARERAPQLQLL